MKLTDLILGQFVRVLKPNSLDKFYIEALKQKPFISTGEAVPTPYPLALDRDHKSSVGSRAVVVYKFKNCVRTRLYNELTLEFSTNESDFDDDDSLESIEAPDLVKPFRDLVEQIVKRKEDNLKQQVAAQKEELKYIKKLAEEYNLELCDAKALFRDISEWHGADALIDEKLESSDYPDIDPLLVKQILEA